MENDEDKLFLLSLLREFKKIPESNKLEARCEIIRAIRNAQQPSFHYSYPNTQFDRGYRNHMYESEYAGRGYQTLDSDYTDEGMRVDSIIENPQLQVTNTVKIYQVHPRTQWIQLKRQLRNLLAKTTLR
ncbi:hypothetical protein HW555_010976 [Spodoptera exigua]|uniref:BESS domain-containing protein n=1 Tax=Spodoptera exigua TaxID=7107 RepID=A0A835G7S6_SPOEX|nr:hypothetical protein HW555_010976 [Spodoptera exigua]